MAKIAIIAYPGARKWLYKHVAGIEAFYDSFEAEQIQPGDEVYGMLSVSQAAQVVELGATYYHLSTAQENAIKLEYNQLLNHQPKLEPFYISPNYEGVVNQVCKKTVAQLNRFWQNLWHKQSVMRAADFKIAFFALMTASGIGIFADALTGVELFKNQLTYWFGKDKQWFADNFTTYWLIELTLGFVLFIWASWSLRMQARSWIPLRDVKRQDSEKAYQGLVLTLSSGYHFIEKNNQWYFVKQKYGEPIEVPLSGNLQQDIEALMPLKVQWELILRIIRSQTSHPNSVLQRVMLLGTQDCSIKNIEGVVERIAPGTYPQIKNALSVLSMYPEFAAVTFESYPVPIPPNDIEAYYNAYLKIAKIWDSQADLPEEGILIDITGGKSVNSVAAALATLHNKMQFHYIDTNNLNDSLVYCMEYRQQNI
ncbi:CRISPR-associated protein Csx16 [Catenovulum sediminis]|uniref:CRISPR-associated protein Csx16 n=1 Tax=Catenovulum sediminis TaxID=1740262 RepID=UPI00163DA686|nr:CRISPR-associated protein Csx16 [Catenovulum sediminis]